MYDLDANPWAPTPEEIETNERIRRRVAAAGRVMRAIRRVWHFAFAFMAVADVAFYTLYWCHGVRLDERINSGWVAIICAIGLARFLYKNLDLPGRHRTDA